MIFLFLIPSVPAGIGNFVLPMMIGARDLALPRINLLSWYLLVIAGVFEIYTLVAAGVDTGWPFTTPLSTHYVNTHVISAAVGVFIAGFSSIFTGLNFMGITYLTPWRSERETKWLSTLPDSFSMMKETRRLTGSPCMSYCAKHSAAETRIGMSIPTGCAVSVYVDVQEHADVPHDRGHFGGADEDG